MCKVNVGRGGCARKNVYTSYTDFIFFNRYAIKGDKVKKKDKLKLNDIDEMTSSNFTRFKLSKSGSYAFVLISTNYYKRNIYRNLKNVMVQGEEQPPNSHQTPSDYPNSYFSGLTAEEQKKDGSFHNLAQRPNEPLDLMVYHKAGADFFIEGLILVHREKFKAQGIKDPEILRKKSNRTIITAMYEGQLRKKGW